MARYLGPKHKICRKFGVKLCDSPKCPSVRRPYQAGQHGPKGSKRLSEYGTQLAEKQKARAIYGILERQFSNYFNKATTQPGDTGENLLRMLEKRVDNVLYRSGLAQSRRMARQLISHGHVRINGKNVNIPSYQCRANDILELKEKSEKLTIIKDAKKKIAKHRFPTWIKMTNTNPIKIEIVNEPEVEEVGVGVNTSLIVEFYSR
ncbi:30S ribosomal protein S4 [Patescibacteria group bacterium]